MRQTADRLADARDETGEGPVGGGRDGHLWFTDIPGAGLHRLDLHRMADGVTVANRRPWLDEAPAEHGRPDGFYWSARYKGGKVIRYSPDGRVDRIVHLPVPRVNMSGFGGADQKTLCITTGQADTVELRMVEGPIAGGPYAIATRVCGLPEPLIRG